MMKSILDFSNKNPGMFGIIQTISILIAFSALFVSLKTYNFQVTTSQRSQTANLVRSRNIAWYLVRFIPIFINEKEPPLSIRVAVDACLKRVSELKISDLEPASMSEPFLDIEVMGKVIYSYWDAKEDPSKLADQYKSNFKLRAKQIDEEIKRQGGIIIDDIAYTSNY